MQNKQLPLLPLESSFMARHIISVSSITFFEGDLFEVQDSISERFKEVCRLNPWLLGTLLDRGRKYPLVLEYSESVEEKTLGRALTFNKEGLALSSTMDYETIVAKTLSCLVQNPHTIANTDALVTALTFQSLEDNPSKFAMIFSMSHSVVDGHSYYKVLNMLFGNDEVVALNVERKNFLNQSLKEAVSLASHHYFFGFAHIGNVLRAGIFGKKSKVQAYYVDNAKLAIQKSKPLKDGDFVSSNDILTSGFFRLIGARVGFMAVNFRDKIEALNQEDAGNYEGAICYDASIYTKASLIRKHLSTGTPYQASTVALPKFMEALFCKLGLISNWSAFAKNLEIAKAKQTLHLPLVGSVSSAPYDICIVFRANSKQKGVILIHKTLTEEAIYEEMPLEKTIS
jgi:hypothetical protein